MFTIFQTNDKLNIVDTNNVSIEIKYNTNCCETFGYLFLKSLPKNNKLKINNSNNIISLTNYNYYFDPKYNKSIIDKNDDHCNYLIFKLINDINSCDYIYLVLFNYTCNGYNTHELIFNNGIIKRMKL